MLYISVIAKFCEQAPVQLPLPLLSFMGVYMQHFFLVLAQTRLSLSLDSLAALTRACLVSVKTMITVLYCERRLRPSSHMHYSDQGCLQQTKNGHLVQDKQYMSWPYKQSLTPVQPSSSILDDFFKDLHYTQQQCFRHSTPMFQKYLISSNVWQLMVKIEGEINKLQL